MKIYRKSGMTYGYVDDTCRNIIDNQGTTLWCVVTINRAATGGDSGGYVAQTFDPTPEFHGIFVAYNSDSSAYVKHSWFTDTFTGLTWGFP